MVPSGGRPVSIRIWEGDDTWVLGEGHREGRSGFTTCLSHLLAIWPWEKHCDHSGSYPVSDGASSAIYGDWWCWNEAMRVKHEHMTHASYYPKESRRVRLGGQTLGSRLITSVWGFIYLWPEAVTEQSTRGGIWVWASIHGSFFFYFWKYRSWRWHQLSP